MKRNNHNAKMDIADAKVERSRADKGESTGSKLSSQPDSDTDLDASSVSASDYLEGSWATVSSEDVTSSQLEDLDSSGDEADKDSTGELSPRHTASAVHSDSEIDPFSDSAYESDELEVSNGRKYEYVTDQSWTDPDKSTPSNSTLSTIQGSFSRGLGNARTPAHSRASTLTRAHLTELSQYQATDDHAQQVISEALEDSQVELVFPRIPGEFGVGSTDTITSASPLLTVKDQISASPQSQAKHHNFRDCSDHQSSEDEYIVLPASSSEPSSSINTNSGDTSRATAHHAFPTHSLHGRRGEKQGLKFIGFGNGLNQRGKRNLEPQLPGFGSNEHAKRQGKKHKSQQEQHSKYPIESIAQRVLDPDQNGYQRLNLSVSTNGPDVSQRSMTSTPDDFCEFVENVDARILGPRTTWPIDQSWLDALSLARSEGLIMVQEPDVTAGDDMPFFSSTDSLRSTDTVSRRELLEPEDMSASDVTVRGRDSHRTGTPANNALPLHSRRLEQVKKLAFVALPLLMMAVLTRLSPLKQNSLYTQSSSEDHQASATFTSTMILVACSTASQESGSAACYQCSQVEIVSAPVITPAPTSLTSSRAGDSLSTFTITLIATPLASRKDMMTISSATERTEPMPSTSTDSQTGNPTIYSRHRARSRENCRSRCAEAKPETSPSSVTVSRAPCQHIVIVDRYEPSMVHVTKNASFVTSFVEGSLALTTALDQGFNSIYEGLVNISRWLESTTWKPLHIRSSGRRLFTTQGSRFFQETDSIKIKVKSELDDLLAVADEHFQQLAIQLDKAIQETKKHLIIAMKDTADAVERHMGIEIPLPAFAARNPDRVRKQSTISSWAEKFWQTLHHATVTLVI